MFLNPLSAQACRLHHAQFKDGAEETSRGGDCVEQRNYSCKALALLDS